MVHPMMPSYLDYQSSRWDDAYQVKPIDCRNCSVVLLGPYSYLGSIYSPLIIDACQQVCAVVDDQSKDEKIFGITKWSSDEFRTRAGRVKDLVAVDLSCSPMGNAVFGRLIEAAGVERVDLVQILAELNLPAVYQTPEVMRELTIARQSDWYALRNSFEDAQSRRTLDAILLLRLTFDRRCLRQVTTSLEDEYFSVYDSRATFTLRDDEVICDAGPILAQPFAKPFRQDHHYAQYTRLNLIAGVFRNSRIWPSCGSPVCIFITPPWVITRARFAFLRPEPWGPTWSKAPCPEKRRSTALAATGISRSLASTTQWTR
jgi:hypothetical protein